MAAVGLGSRPAPSRSITTMWWRMLSHTPSRRTYEAACIGSPATTLSRSPATFLASFLLYHFLGRYTERREVSRQSCNVVAVGSKADVSIGSNDEKRDL